MLTAMAMSMVARPLCCSWSSVVRSRRAHRGGERGRGVTVPDRRWGGCCLSRQSLAQHAAQGCRALNPTLGPGKHPGNMPAHCNQHVEEGSDRKRKCLVRRRTPLPHGPSSVAPSQRGDDLAHMWWGRPWHQDWAWLHATASPDWPMSSCPGPSLSGLPWDKLSPAPQLAGPTIWILFALLDHIESTLKLTERKVPSDGPRPTCAY